MRLNQWIGCLILGWLDSTKRIGAFAIITLVVTLTQWNKSAFVLRPLVARQINRAGLLPLPMLTFLGVALGLVVSGQTVALLSRVGAVDYAGVIMVSVIVRELGPMVTVLLVLARVGTGIVIELSTSRALGEVEALEALGIDPIHYLVMPRVIGLALSVFSLTVYLVLIALISGFLFTFIQDVPLTPATYLAQMSASLRWEDFILLGLKTLSFGVIIALITCFQGLAHAVRLEEVSYVTTQAIIGSVVACVLIDAVFIVAYLLL